MKNLLLVLLGQYVVSLTVEVGQPNSEMSNLKPVDHTVDRDGNIYVLMMNRVTFTDLPFSMVISKYHPQHGLQWSKEYKHGS